MPIEQINGFVGFLTLPHTNCSQISTLPGYAVVFFLEKTTPFEVCPKCASKAFAVHDHRIVKIQDAPIRNGQSLLVVRKRRFRCPNCKSVFMEPLDGVRKQHRTTERLKSHLCQAAEKYQDLERVRKDFQVSDGFVYKVVYDFLEFERRKRLYPWPKVIGIDEHSFSRDKRTGEIAWATVVVDHKNKRLFEIVPGRDKAAVKKGLENIPGAHNVAYVTMDLSDTFRNAAKEMFPNAQCVADAFHVVRLFHFALKEIEKVLFIKDKNKDRKPRECRLLHRKFSDLSKPQKDKLNTWLLAYPPLSKMHRFKEEIEKLFSIRQVYERTRDQFVKLINEMQRCGVLVAQNLAKTLVKWKAEIAAAFRTHYSNGRVEGYNNKAKLVKREAFGFRNFGNYRLRLLNACAGSR